MKLAIHESGRFVRAISTRRDVVRIGRLPTCEVVLEGDGVARYHAVIERSVDGTWALLGMGPSETRLNGQAVTRARLNPGDELSIGTYKIRVLEEEREAQEIVIVAEDDHLIAAPIAEVLWSATAAEMAAEPTTGEVPIPLELVLDDDEPIYLLTQRKRRA